ncbi:MAG: response regulator transcription factor [Acidimicrobiia bacterium]|jgi:DNA-binding response OmpR family regulator|nr:response regulator transcription factor [Acidimicrobiia bacterium]
MLGPTYPCSVVVVDADHAARRRLVEGLSAEGLGASGTAAGLAGVEQALQEPCDAMVVAVPLPDLTTRQFLGMVRAVGDFPIVVLGAAPGEVAVVLDAGADDAVAGRPSAREVAARVRAVRRRSRAEGAEEPVRVGRLVVDPARREARLGNRALELSRKEFDLLHALARRRGRVATRRELLAEVWDQPLGGPDKTLDVHLSWLRQKLGESGTAPRYLHTVRGVGIRLIDPGA